MLDYPPLSRGPLISYKQAIFWKAPTSSSHRNLILGYWLTAGLKPGGSKCARLFTPAQGRSISVSCIQSIFVKPQPVGLTRS